MDRVIAKQIAGRVRELLKTKDQRTQKIISMRVNGISYYEISEKIGVSVNSARVIDFRAKKWLKSYSCPISVLISFARIQQQNTKETKREPPSSRD